MFKGNYYFNNETLRFERSRTPVRRKVVNALIYMSIMVVLATGLRLLTDIVFSSPKLKYLSLRGNELRDEYRSLNNIISKSEFYLSEIQKRDDRMYRSVFDLDPVPASVREAGYGGTDIYNGDLTSGRSNQLVYNTALKLEKLSNKAKVQSGSLYDLFGKAQSQQKLIASKPSIQPISPGDTFRITSYFGFRWDPFTHNRRMHQGIDLAGETGLKIYATGDGTVISAIDAKNGYGKEVIIDHGFGYITRYAHLNRIDVEMGQRLKRGQYIGRLGSTGRSTGPHLHYEVIYNDRAMNPLLYYYEDLAPGEYELITRIASD